MGGSRHFRHPHTPILVRERFRGFATVHLRYDLSICSPSCRSRLGFHPAYEDFYFRASDGLVTRSAAGYNYRGNWASSPWQDFHLLERQLASLQPIARSINLDDSISLTRLGC
jgi:hypothetical protein